MNTRKGILGLLLMALLPLSAQTAERGLKECIRMGIERNLGLKNARIAIETGRTTVSQARANLLPQVNGTLQAGDYLKRPVNVTTSTLLGADFPDTPTWGKVRSMPLTTQGAIQVGVPLYNATIYAAINAAKVVESLNRTAYEKARLDLSYCVITAPSDGYLGRRTIEEGQLVGTGQTVTTIISGTSKWVVANFKETQVERLRVGQRVSISVDAFKGKEFAGTVSAISSATGSKYSMVPTDNSAGNFVKIQQRVPVRIDFEGLTDEDNQRLAAGMMCEIKVKVKSEE